MTLFRARMQSYHYHDLETDVRGSSERMPFAMREAKLPDSGNDEIQELRSRAQKAIDATARALGFL